MSFKRFTMFFAALGTAALAMGADGDWANWRGPSDNGMARGDAPLKWSDEQGVAWKANIPGRGFSSPVVWGDKVFVTTAVPTSGAPAMMVEHKMMLIALDRKTGKQLWEKTAKVATPHQGYHPTYGSYASISPITDGKYVYANFGSRGLYCYTINGDLVWQKEFGQFNMFMSFGEGAWTTLDGEKLIVLLDHEGESAIVALNKNDGKELWRTPRQGQTNWAGPVMVTHEGKKQIIVAASRGSVAYDPETGKEIWSLKGLGQNTIPAPVAADGLVVLMSGFRNPNLQTVKLGREGDLTGTDAVVWENNRGNSYTSSPLLHDGKFYMITDSGMLSCFDLKTGKPYYQQQRTGYNYKASLVGANGKLYLATENEDVLVVKMGETFEILATNKLKDQVFIASPAIVDGEIYLRSQNTLFAIK